MCRGFLNLTKPVNSNTHFCEYHSLHILSVASFLKIFLFLFNEFSPTFPTTDLLFLRYSGLSWKHVLNLQTDIFILTAEIVRSILKASACISLSSSRQNLRYILDHCPVLHIKVCFQLDLRDC